MQVMEMSPTYPFFMFLSVSSLFSLTELKKKTFSEVSFHARDTTTIVAYSLWKGNSLGLKETRHHSGFDACLLYMFCDVHPFMF